MKIFMIPSQAAGSEILFTPARPHKSPEVCGDAEPDAKLRIRNARKEFLEALHPGQVYAVDIVPVSGNPSKVSEQSPDSTNQPVKDVHKKRP